MYSTACRVTGSRDVTAVDSMWVIVVIVVELAEEAKLLENLTDNAHFDVMSMCR